MPNYDFTSTLSPLDFQILCKDLLQAELAVTLESFSEGPDKGVDLRYSADPSNILIVQCKRYDPSAYSLLKSKMLREELPKIRALNPARYILATSANLSVRQVDELTASLSPYVKSSSDIYGRERLNDLLAKFPEIERRTIKLWVSSTGVLQQLLNAGLHAIADSEVKRVQAAAKLYVRNQSFDDALKILNEHNVCIISGIPGVGKTTLARMLLLYYYERGYEIVKIESDIREASEAAYHNKPRFFYYDDFLGQTALPDKLVKNEDQKLLDFIATIRESENSKLVLTTREYILNQARQTYEKLHREPLTCETYILDLARYTRRNKAQILYNHLYFSELPSEYLHAIRTGRGYLKLVDHPNFNPRLVEFLTARSRTRDVSPSGFLSFCVGHLDDPQAVWKHAVEHQLSQAAVDTLTVLTTLPNQVLSEDLALAFWQYHLARTSKFNSPCGPQDYLNALSELEGAFISTRRAKQDVIVGFMNPSVRDFMQNQLLGSNTLTDLVSSCVHFEQPQWLWATFADEGSRLPKQHLALNVALLRKVLMELFQAPSCHFIATEYAGQIHRIDKRKEPNIPERLAFLLDVLSFGDDRTLREFILSQIFVVASRLSDAELSLGDCLSLIEQLLGSDLASTSEAEALVKAVKEYTNKSPDDLNEYSNLAELVDNNPPVLLPEQLTYLGERFSSFCDTLVEDIVHGRNDDYTDPEDVRAAAEQVRQIGASLLVNTAQHYSSLREFAREQEIDQEFNRDWDDDESHGGGQRSELCSDAEIDSMFATLDGHH